MLVHAGACMDWASKHVQQPCMGEGVSEWPCLVGWWWGGGLPLTFRPYKFPPLSFPTNGAGVCMCSPWCNCPSPCAATPCPSVLFSLLDLLVTSSNVSAAGPISSGCRPFRCWWTSSSPTMHLRTLATFHMTACMSSTSQWPDHQPWTKATFPLGHLAAGPSSIHAARVEGGPSASSVAWCASCLEQA